MLPAARQKIGLSLAGAGFACLVAGAALIWVPLALLVAGCVLLYIARSLAA